MIIQSKKVWVLGNWLEAQIEVEDGKISAILPYVEKTADKDYGDKRIVPGFIDIHWRFFGKRTAGFIINQHQFRRIFVDSEILQFDSQRKFNQLTFIIRSPPFGTSHPGCHFQPLHCTCNPL